MQHTHTRKRDAVRPPLHQMDSIAELWSAYFNFPITANQVAMVWHWSNQS
jgi:hypothetical protein